MTPHRLALALLALALSLPAVAGARQLTVDGRLEVLQIDDFDHGRSRLVHKVRDERTGREYELEGVEPGLRHGTRIRAKGRVKRGVRRDGARVLAGPGDAAVSLTVLDAAMPAAALVAGGRKALVIVVDFAQDAKTVACSDGAIAGKMFTADPSVDKLYQQTSFGQLWWPADTNGNGAPDVVRVSIDDAGNDCNTGAWRSLADAEAAKSYTLSNYQHKLYVLPSNVACSWAGYAQVGCGSSCWAMVATCDRGDVYAHELGHNLGMWHASFDADANGAVDASCPWGSWSGGGEYCDDSDFMGISTNVWRQVNGPHKHQMGWIPSNKIVDVAGSGSYTLAPLETDPAATTLPLLLRVARPAPASGYYYVSYRRRIGYDANMRSSYADRTSIHTHPGGNTLLVRFLADGETFAEPAGGLSVRQVSHDTVSATVAVSMTCGNGVRDAGEECDGADLGGATCGGCAGTPSCTASCRLDTSACTNGVCDASETCASCPADCVGAGAVCGNGVCEAGNGESCVSCPADCNGKQGGNPNQRFCCGFAGSNPVGCSATQCGACTTAPISVCCGDAVCTGDETQANCLRDCPPCTDADGDGYCPSRGDCNDANPNVRPNAAEACSGGVDEDCDGLVDCFDPGCATSPSCTTCLPLGASCSQGGQCCSLVCGGKGKNKTCR